MLCAIAVAVSFAEPILLDAIPITPEFLVGRWEMLSTSAPVDPQVREVTAFHKDGTYTSHLTNLPAHSRTPVTQSGTYAINQRSVTTTLTSYGKPITSVSELTLLPGGRVRFRTSSYAGTSTVSVYAKAGRP